MKNHTSQENAFLYARVSTEEQASHGGSLKVQQDLLRQYCQLNDILIRKVFVEDYSAKTFNRPEWRKLMSAIEVTADVPDYLLFTRWDRFSRNAGDAYYIIKKLRRLGVDPQAIEQPLDLAVPENKMMLAFYLAIPEVENDRRGLNVKQGIRKAKELGKWIGPAPIGYANYSSSDGIKGIIRKEPEASIIQTAFKDLAESGGSITDAYRTAVKYGLNCSKSNFWNVLQNPTYTGNIKINDEDGESYLVPAVHVGIISMTVFEKVQELFKRPKTAKRTAFNLNFMLRRFLECPRCARTLTGSFSSGRKSRYAYYHCMSGCRYRVRADELHKKFNLELRALQMSPEYCLLYKQVVRGVYKAEMTKLNAERDKTLKAIELFTDRVAKGKNLFLDSLINFQDYQCIRDDCEEKISILGNSISSASIRQIEISSRIETIVEHSSRLDMLFLSLDERNKCRFLNLFLVRTSNWECLQIGHIFQRPVQVVYGIRPFSDPDIGRLDRGLVVDFLQSLADLELTRAETLGVESRPAEV